jgi:hypothetical protein
MAIFKMSIFILCYFCARAALSTAEPSNATYDVRQINQKIAQVIE